MQISFSKQSSAVAYCLLDLSINDMAEVLNASQMQKLQEVLVKRLSENTVSDYLQTTNMDFLDMFLTAKHLEGCSDKNNTLL